jgi:hypothetical protein
VELQRYCFAVETSSAEYKKIKILTFFVVVKLGKAISKNRKFIL